MLYLLNENLEVIARGESLDGEFVFDPETKRTLKDLKAIATATATANSIEHDSKIKLADLASLITDAFSEMDLPETLDKRGIVVAGIKAGKTDDAIMLELIEAGIPVRDAYGEFKTALMAAGLLLKTKERNEKLAVLLEDFAPETGDDVSDMVSLMMEELPRTTERQAMGAIRKYAKENDLTLPKVKRLGGWKKKLFDWIVENPTESVETMTVYLIELGRPETVAKRHADTMRLVNRIANGPDDV